MRMPSARLLLAASLLTSLSVFVAACSSQPSPEAPPSARQDATYGQQAGYPQRPPAASAAPAATGAYPGQLRSEGLTADAWANLPPPADVPTGLAQIDAAERALAMVLGEPAKNDAQATSPTTKRAEPPPPPALPLAQDQACSIACSALASMKRSADHVCTMAGDKDAVCGTARERVQRAEARVTAACPACSK